MNAIQNDQYQKFHPRKENVKEKLHGNTLITERSDEMNFSKEFTAAKWHMNFGANSHMLGNERWFCSYEPFKKPAQVRLRNAAPLLAFGIGTINILAFDGKSWIPKHLEKILFVPEL